MALNVRGLSHIARHCHINVSGACDVGNEGTIQAGNAGPMAGKGAETGTQWGLNREHPS